MVPANTFDNVKGDFPIGFQIWYTGTVDYFQQAEADVYNAKGEFLEKKNLYSYDQDLFIINWLRQYYNKNEKHYAYLRYLGTDFQNNKGVFITLKPSDNDLKQVKGNWITPNNIIPMVTYWATARGGNKVVRSEPVEVTVNDEEGKPTTKKVRYISYVGE